MKIQYPHNQSERTLRRQHLDTALLTINLVFRVTLDSTTGTNNSFTSPLHSPNDSSHRQLLLEIRESPKRSLLPALLICNLQTGMLKGATKCCFHSSKQRGETFCTEQILPAAVKTSNCNSDIKDMWWQELWNQAVRLYWRLQNAAVAHHSSRNVVNYS